MIKQLDFLYIATVASKDADMAFRFHEKMATTSDSHLVERDEDDFKDLIENGYVFGLWIGLGEKLVALCYVAPSKHDEKSWEIGGMVVDDTLKQRRMGSLLVRFALAHTIVFQQPWENNQRLIAHVQEGNKDPRRLIDSLGFHYVKKVELANPPKSMKRNAEGKVVGDEFELPPAASKALASWFHQELDQLMKQLNVEFGLNPEYDLETLKAALVDIANKYR